MGKDDSEIIALREELNNLIAQIKTKQEEQVDCKLAEKCGDMADPPKCKLVTRKSLKGHINKVNSVHYTADSRSIENLVS